MRLSREELDLLTVACANPDNAHAQRLVDEFGVDYAIHIIDHIPYVPLAIVTGVVTQLWSAMNFEAQRAGGSDFRWLVEPPADRTE